MIFGDGAFGPEGVFYCCAVFTVVPLLYVTAFSITRGSNALRMYVVAAVNVVVVFGITGALFGDAVGGFLALIMALLTFTGLSFGPRRTIRMGQQMGGTRIITTMRQSSGAGDLFTSMFGGDPTAGKAKRNDDEGEPIIIERPPEP